MKNKLEEINIYLDTEFHEYQKKSFLGDPIDTIDLISIGMFRKVVAKDGTEGHNALYCICKEFDVKAAWNNVWLKENVLLPIYYELLEIGNISGDERNKWEFILTDFARLLKRYGETKARIREDILRWVLDIDGEFISNWNGGTLEYLNILKDTDFSDEMKVRFYGYFSDYDWVLFCWIFGRMEDQPKTFPMFCHDLKQMMEERSLDVDWKEKHCPDPVEAHKASVDAKWNYDFHQVLIEYDSKNTEQNEK